MASEKITKIIDAVKELSVLELKELIDTYCEEFGVSAVAAAALPLKIPASIFNGAVAVILAPPLCLALRHALKRAHLQIP